MWVGRLMFGAAQMCVVVIFRSSTGVWGGYFPEQRRCVWWLLSGAAQMCGCDYFPLLHRCAGVVTFRSSVGLWGGYFPGQHKCVGVVSFRGNAGV